MRILAILSLLTLAACGADGAPTPPSKATAQPGLAVTGQVKVGLSGS